MSDVHVDEGLRQTESAIWAYSALAALSAAGYARPMVRAVRWSRAGSALVASLLAACAGGQTGEITDLTACDEAVGVVSIDEASDAGRSARAQLAAFPTALEGELTWSAGGATTITVSAALSGAPATVMSGDECERPHLEAPIAVTVRTADGALDDTLRGTIALSDVDAAVAQASLAFEERSGSLALDPDLDPARASVRVVLELHPETMLGQLFVSSGTGDGDERPLASFF